MGRRQREAVAAEEKLSPAHEDPDKFEMRLEKKGVEMGVRNRVEMEVRNGVEMGVWNMVEMGVRNGVEMEVRNRVEIGVRNGAGARME